jgi:hypothetical protein
MDRSLQHTSGENDERLTGSQAAADAIEFLEANPYAKIVVIIDTHAAENGYFVWAKDANGDYQACSLLEVGVACWLMCLPAHTAFTDPSRLYSQGDLQLHVQCRGCPVPPPQDANRESCLRSFGLSGPATE